MQHIVIGVDVGGSHVTSAAIDMQKHEIIKGSFSECKIDHKASAEEILNGWTQAISETISSIDRNALSAICFAMPSPFDYVNGIALFENHEKFKRLHGVNIGKEIISKLNLNNDFPIRFINDATSFAIGEAWLGKGKNSQRIIAITLGTGFGSAFILNGLPVLAAENVPMYGCLWHLPYKNGIADDYFSTRWFVNGFYDKTGVKISGVKELVDHAGILSDVNEIFIEFGTNLGKFLAPWVKSFDAEMVVMGGNISGAFNLFGEAMLWELGKTKSNVKVEVSDLKENAAIIGCSRLQEKKYWKDVEDLLKLM